MARLRVSSVSAVHARFIQWTMLVVGRAPAAQAPIQISDRRFHPSHSIRRHYSKFRPSRCRHDPRISLEPHGHQRPVARRSAK